MARRAVPFGQLREPWVQLLEGLQAVPLSRAAGRAGGRSDAASRGQGQAIDRPSFSRPGIERHRDRALQVARCGACPVGGRVHRRAAADDQSGRRRVGRLLRNRGGGGGGGRALLQGGPLRSGSRPDPVRHYSHIGCRVAHEAAGGRLDVPASIRRGLWFACARFPEGLDASGKTAYRCGGGGGVGRPLLFRAAATNRNAARSFGFVRGGLLALGPAGGGLLRGRGASAGPARLPWGLQQRDGMADGGLDPARGDGRRRTDHVVIRSRARQRGGIQRSARPSCCCRSLLDWRRSDWDPKRTACHGRRPSR